MPNEKSILNYALAAELRAERAIRNLTQRELIERSGIPKQTLIRLFKGERDISVTQLTSLSGAMGIGADVFMRRAVDRAQAMEAEASGGATASEVPGNVRRIGDKRADKLSADEIDGLRGKAAMDDPEMNEDEDFD